MRAPLLEARQVRRGRRCDPSPLDRPSARDGATRVPLPARRALLSNAQDPISRRYVWDIIQDAKAGRAIVLTTHRWAAGRGRGALT